ncbi:hypothetical protein [Streptomyces sp. NBC_00467]|uniref:hypothetical protein n=1 Tax=Streptomyces sp. NBC_00467 TaxID=2975752 RepID=UPI002E16FBE1
MTVPCSFPDDLRALQLEIIRIRAAYEAHCRSLPWSVEPMIGVPYEQPFTDGCGEPVIDPDSPGCTPEQIEADRMFRTKIAELAAAIHAHPWWAEIPAGEGVDAPVALKPVGNEQQTAEPSASG